MKAILHLEILVYGKHVAWLHVTHMWGDTCLYLKFRNHENTQVLTIDTLYMCMWFQDSTNRIHKDGLSIR